MSKDSIFKVEDRLVSVIVPVFNEAENIIENINLIISEIEDHFSHFEILVISDGSTDETNLKVASFKHENLRLIVSKQNQGKGAAVRKGFGEARGDYIFFIDGGLELHPKELRIFIGLMRLYDADIVIGSKRHPQSVVYYPLYRKFLSRIYQLITKILFQINVTDSQVGLKLFRKEVINKIMPDLTIDRYGFDLEILSLAKVYGFSNFLEAPIRLDYFSNNTKSLPFDLIHVARVGISLLKDTLNLFLRLKKIQKRKETK